MTGSSLSPALAALAGILLIVAALNAAETNPPPRRRRTRTEPSSLRLRP